MSDSVEREDALDHVFLLRLEARLLERPPLLPLPRLTVLLLLPGKHLLLHLVHALPEAAWEE